ncbi:transcriptional regulator [Caballeronia sp. S22]|uniref:COG4315 family predicted lipoprotein n=1 Tax=Caballeronia sp. S22 TaxID=3137182 RepID=UPI0035311B74
MKTLIGIAALSAVTSTFAAPPHVSDGRLVDDHGMTLYVFGGQGAPDAKSCEGDCARNFPPALASKDDKASGLLQLVDTGNGDRQWTYGGKPLYRGMMDKKPGDRAGDGLNTVWHSVQPH